MPDIADTNAHKTDKAADPKDTTLESNALKTDPAAQLRVEGNTSARPPESVSTAGLHDVPITGTGTDKPALRSGEELAKSFIADGKPMPGGYFAKLLESMKPEEIPAFTKAYQAAAPDVAATNLANLLYFRDVAGNMPQATQDIWAKSIKDMTSAEAVAPKQALETSKPVEVTKPVESSKSEDAQTLSPEAAKGALGAITTAKNQLGLEAIQANPETQKQLNKELTAIEDAVKSNSPDAKQMIQQWNNNLTTLAKDGKISVRGVMRLEFEPSALYGVPQSENLPFHPANEAAWKAMVSGEAQKEASPIENVVINTAAAMAEKMEQAADLAKAGKGPALTPELISQIRGQVDETHIDGFAESALHSDVLLASREDVGRAYFETMQKTNPFLASMTYEDAMKKVTPAAAEAKVESVAKPVDKVAPTDKAELPIKNVDDLSKIWNDNPKSYVQKGYFEVNAQQVDANAHPNGLMISTTEAPIVLQKDLAIPGQVDAEGKPLILKAGTALPNGVQFSPSTVVENGKDAKGAPIRTMDDVTLLTPKDGVRLADGTMLKSVGLGEVEIASGQVAKPGTFVIQRDSVDLETGKARIDTYTNTEAKFGSNWVEVPGKPGVYAPNLGGAAGMEVVQVPPGEDFKFKASYDPNGPFVEAKSGDFLKADYKDGKLKGYYRVSAQDALETHVATDEPTAARLNALQKGLEDASGAKIERATPSEKGVEDLTKVWDASEKGHVQKGYFEVQAKQVDAQENPKGLLISSTEHPMVLQADLTIPGQTGADGKPLVLKAGTVLPNGVQLSPTEVNATDKTSDDQPIRDMQGVKLITPPEGVKLPDGTTLHSTGKLAELTVSNGQEAKPGTFVIQRNSVDLGTGQPRIDTYTNTDAKFAKNWKAVSGESGVYSPNLDGAAPMEVVQVPEGQTFKFKASYDPTGPWVVAREGDLLKQELNEDGSVKGYYRVSGQDGLETHVPTDAASAAKLGALAESIKTKTGATVLRAGTDADAFAALKKAAATSEIRAAAPQLDTMAQADINKTVGDFGKTTPPEVMRDLFMNAVRDPAEVGRYLEQFKDPADKAAARDMLDKVNGLSESQRRVFDETMAKDPRAAIDLGGKDIPEGRGSEVMGKIGTAVAVLAIIAAAIALAKSAHASEAPKKKVPFFQGSAN